MIVARAARVLIAVALLAAQQAALGHQVWHLGAGAVHAAAGSTAGGDRGGTPAPQERLCDLHASLGAVLGALDCVAKCAESAGPGAQPSVGADLPAVSVPALPSTARGPPILL